MSLLKGELLREKIIPPYYNLFYCIRGIPFKTLFILESTKSFQYSSENFMKGFSWCDLTCLQAIWYLEVRSQIFSSRSILMHFLFFLIFQFLTFQPCTQEVAVLIRPRESEQMSIKGLVIPWDSMMQMLASIQPINASISAREDVLTRHLGITSV